MNTRYTIDMATKTDVSKVVAAERTAMTHEQKDAHCSPAVAQFRRDIRAVNERLGITEEYSRSHYNRLVAKGLA